MSLLRSRLAKGVVTTAALALTVGISGCGAAGGEQTEGPTRQFEADNGTVEIPQDPKRVVATGYAVPTLIEANAPLVGISSWERGEPLMSDEDLKTYKDLPRVAGETAAETNYDAIAEQDPDLIVIGVPKPIFGEIDAERLESIAPVVAVGPEVPSAWREVSQKQADAAGALEKFDEVKNAYESKADELKQKYADVLPDLELAHVGGYGEAENGNFQREFDGSWGTNIANDIGAKYYGEVEEKGKGSRAVSEYPSLEELPSAMREADAITYTVDADGSAPQPVKYAMDSNLWKNLPAVKKDMTFPIKYTEAATYGQAQQTLEALDETFAPLLKK
ncbi:MULTISPECIES: ABC transporter substrate-binding protein [Prauserella salsuginis group]|uniref:ABC transporter substrate-binding protein n=1 Tax=Prauserella salsuginis TaxID=387889 RepID=A0ABW6G6V9_9PSEU|nr:MULTISPECIES: ABC transporter substrate-binding protein [Prauserella salsuginis group]MCR3722676.1 iron complex transport system substrate-binding protein [Prauserella flava]MCR3737269.1 iron complex transport system substrate-binding protein [Prauserella salsuginis]